MRIHAQTNFTLRKFLIQTPLHDATRNHEDTKVMELLLAHGADPNRGTVSFPDKS